jgi:hypothetical protein
MMSHITFVRTVADLLSLVQKVVLNYVRPDSHLVGKQSGQVRDSFGENKGVNSLPTCWVGQCVTHTEHNLSFITLCSPCF